MAIDVWIGAVTTLAGTAVGGGISYLVSRQQARDAHAQRDEEHLRDQRRQSADRRFQAYADFLIRARSFRNALQTHYAHPRSEPSLAEIESILHSANDASTLVFLAELNSLLGRATREFQNAARSELGVPGPAEAWDRPSG